MRTSAPVALAALALAASAPAALGAAGGATLPGRDSARSGSTPYGSDLPLPAARPVAARMALAERTVTAGSELPAVRFRVDQRGMEQVQARVVAQRAAGKAQVFRRSAGWVRTGRTVTVRWGSEDVAPKSGRWVVRLHVKDSRGRTLKRTTARPGRTLLRVRPAPAAPAVPVAPAPDLAPATGTLPATTASPGGRGVFPVVGPFTFGGPDSRFGTGRPGHVHEGQDVAAAAGQSVVAPYAGTVNKTAYQASAAGEYVVLDAVDGRSYVFAHCTRNSTAVRTGQAVAAGAELCRVGSTGGVSGPHLHFEIWAPGWRVAGSRPIDPLPELRSWAGL